MAGLSDISSTKEVQQTTLPSWYTTAQQDVYNKAATANAPSFGQTVGGQAATGAFGQGSAFGTAKDTLSAIASGAVNPWNITTDATGAQVVSPDVSTPLGGLFKAQTDYLTSMMPDIAAGQTGRAIAGGGFGSSMNQAAVGRAKSQAINKLFEQQNLAALQGLQTAASAGGALGTLGANELKGALDLATAEQGSPYSNAINLANILAKLQQPATQTTTKTPNLAQQIGGLDSLIKSGKAGLDAIMKSSLTSGAKNLFKSLFQQEGVDTTGWVQDPTTGLWTLEGETSDGSSDDTGEPFDIIDDSYSGGGGGGGGDSGLDDYYQDNDDIFEFDPYYYD